MFAWIFKVIATIASIATTALLVTQSVQRGLIIATTIFGIIKIIVIFLFFAVLALILYLLLKDSFRANPAKESL